MLGAPVAHCLKAAGFQVRIMTRDPQKAKKLFGDSFEIFTGEAADAHCLEEAMSGCFGVHISLPTEVEQQAAEMVARAAPRLGVERITYISGATVAEEHRYFPMIERKFLAEKAIAESGVGYAIFCPTWIMEGLALFVQQGRAVVLGKQPTPYRFVAADDQAEMVLNAYRCEEAPNRKVFVYGPEAVRMQEALKRYCAACHPEIRQLTAMPFWLVRLLAAVTHDPGLKAAGEMMAYFEKVGEENSAARVDDLLGTPSTTLEQWLETKSGK
jgi:uncharacterized protein YbjT (DUF2867 family)